MQLNQSGRLGSFLFVELKYRLTRSTPICSSNWRTQESTGSSLCPGGAQDRVGLGGDLGAGQGSSCWGWDTSEPRHGALLKLPLKKPALRSKVGPSDFVLSQSSS